MVPIVVLLSVVPTVVVLTLVLTVVLLTVVPIVVLLTVIPTVVLLTVVPTVVLLSVVPIVVLLSVVPTVVLLTVVPPVVVLTVVPTVVLLTVVPTVVLLTVLFLTLVPNLVPTVVLWKESALFSLLARSVVMRGRWRVLEGPTEPAELLSPSIIVLFCFVGTLMTLSIRSRMGSDVFVEFFSPCFSELVTMLYLMFTLTFSGLRLRFVIIRMFSCINLSSF